MGACWGTFALARGSSPSSTMTTHCASYCAPCQPQTPNSRVAWHPLTVLGLKETPGGADVWERAGDLKPEDRNPESQTLYHHRRIPTLNPKHYTIRCLEVSWGIFVLERGSSGRRQPPSSPARCRTSSFLFLFSVVCRQTGSLGYNPV